MNGWEGIPQASAQGNERKKSAKPTAVNEARPAYEVRFAIRKPCKAVERPLCMIEIPCPRTDTLLTHRARGCRGDAKPPAFFNANFSDKSDNSDNSDSAQTMERGEGRDKAFLTVPPGEMFFHPKYPEYPAIPR